MRATWNGCFTCHSCLTRPAAVLALPPPPADEQKEEWCAADPRKTFKLNKLTHRVRWHADWLLVSGVAWRLCCLCNMPLCIRGTQLYQRSF